MHFIKSFFWKLIFLCAFFTSLAANSAVAGGILGESFDFNQYKFALLQQLWEATIPDSARPAPVTDLQVSKPKENPDNGKLQSCSNIMPLGDSITVGVNGGYRNTLYTGLQENNCGVSFVGTLSDENTRVSDKDHEGHPGYSIENIAANVNSWLTATKPNIILLMIGTNDTAWWSAESAEQIAARHNSLIDTIRANRPDAWIFVASIPPQTSKNIQPNGIDRAVLTRRFNEVIRNNVKARVETGERIRFVDVSSVLTTADLYDGIHPTEQAHAKIGKKFLEVIRNTLGSTS